MTGNVGEPAPSVVWPTRVKPEGKEEFEWKQVKSDDLFKVQLLWSTLSKTPSQGKRVVIFSLPGAFTPTCSSTHLPGYEMSYDDIKAKGIDEVYCLSVNDSFVMNAWAKDQGIKKVKVIADGNGEFSSGMGMLVDKSNLGFGRRSWRYSMIVKDGVVEKIFVEENKRDKADSDPFQVSDARSMLAYLAK
eukprot:GHVN01015266.1.p1 GENE.GHVN01015266.1~~GHVN01015266.1.p1  ORF type:complete len:189 (+),score=26.15 GHVN01015266.1:447-1013(+)